MKKAVNQNESFFGRKHALLACILFVLFIPRNSDAQKMGFEETLSYINTKLGSQFKVTVEKGIIIASFYESGSTLYREDQVNPRDVDTNKIYYNASEQLFCLNCHGGKNKCVDRNLYVNKISRGYSRMSFHVTLDERSVQGLRRAFIHLIKLITIHNYKNDVSFE